MNDVINATVLPTANVFLPEVECAVVTKESIYESKATFHYLDYDNMKSIFSKHSRNFFENSDT